MPSAKVYIVGAGPGDPKLLTLRALELISGADVVIYDRLIDRGILDLIPKGVRRIYVGKDPQNDISQGEINALLVSEARRGNKVVRLKGGDPFLFSRGGEETEALRANKVDFEIVPGVSSAWAAAAFAGIPLTHRKHSSSVAIVTGHEDPFKKEPNVKWSLLASSVDTIIILMGVGMLEEISRELTKAGLSPDTPVAAIEWATTDKQRTFLFPLKEAPKVKHRLNPPSVIIIGKVAALAKEFGWFSKGTQVAATDHMIDLPILSQSR